MLSGRAARCPRCYTATTSDVVSTRAAQWSSGSAACKKEPAGPIATAACSLRLRAAAVGPDVPEARHDTPCFRSRFTSTRTSCCKSSSSSSQLEAKANRRRGRVRLRVQAKVNACASGLALVEAARVQCTLHLISARPTQRATTRSTRTSTTQLAQLHSPFIPTTAWTPSAFRAAIRAFLHDKVHALPIQQELQYVPAVLEDGRLRIGTLSLKTPTNNFYWTLFMLVYDTEHEFSRLQLTTSHAQKQFNSRNNYNNNSFIQDSISTSRNQRSTAWTDEMTRRHRSSLILAKWISLAIPLSLCGRSHGVHYHRICGAMAPQILEKINDFFKFK